jgi:predicted Zn finger-like uncharacterized protein
MIIQCPDCTTRYELDDSRVPAGRIRVRCARCAYVFPIEAEAPVPEAPAPEAPVLEDAGISQDPWAANAQDPAPEVEVEPMDTISTSEPQESFEAEPMMGLESTRIEDPGTAGVDLDPGLDLEIERPEIARERKSAAHEPVTPEMATATMSPEPAPVEEKGSTQDQKAKRLARALVSDILVYNRDKRDKALAEGALVQALGQEIKKSWELYKERVTPEVANDSNYFKDALNDILADGQKIF